MNKSEDFEEKNNVKCVKIRRITSNTKHHAKQDILHFKYVLYKYVNFFLNKISLFFPDYMYLRL